MKLSGLGGQHFNFTICRLSMCIDIPRVDKPSKYTDIYMFVHWDIKISVKHLMCVLCVFSLIYVSNYFILFLARIFVFVVVRRAMVQM